MRLLQACRKGYESNVLSGSNGDPECCRRDQETSPWDMELLCVSALSGCFDAHPSTWPHGSRLNCLQSDQSTSVPSRPRNESCFHVLTPPNTRRPTFKSSTVIEGGGGHPCFDMYSSTACTCISVSKRMRHLNASALIGSDKNCRCLQKSSLFVPGMQIESRWRSNTYVNTGLLCT